MCCARCGEVQGSGCTIYRERSNHVPWIEWRSRMVERFGIADSGQIATMLVLPMRLLEEGQTVRDTYEVERFLGEGAFAEVYRVRHRFLGRQAMKVFKRVGMSLDEIQEMLGKPSSSPNLSTPTSLVFATLTSLTLLAARAAFFTMEYLPGQPGQVLAIPWHSIDPHRDDGRHHQTGLPRPHSGAPRKTTHHPSRHQAAEYSGWLRADGLRARVSDFGLAKKGKPLTLLATAAGTLAFKPPEAFAERKGVVRGRCLGLGVTLYLLLTDQLPFHVDPDLGWSNRAGLRKDLESPVPGIPMLTRHWRKLSCVAWKEIRPNDMRPRANCSTPSMLGNVPRPAKTLLQTRRLLRSV